MSANILSSYSPEDVKIIISNNEFSHVISGLAEGSFVSVTRDTATTSLVIGADMTAMRVRRKNRSGTINITLHQGGDSNDVLSQLLKNDEDDTGWKWLFRISVISASDRSFFFSDQAYIETLPEVSFSTEGENRSWAIKCLNIDSHVGGGGRLDPATVDTLRSLGYEPNEYWVEQ